MNRFEKEAREERRRGRASNPLIKAGGHSLSFDGLKTWEIGRNGSRKSPGFPRPYAMEGCPHRGRPMAPSERGSKDLRPATAAFEWRDAHSVGSTGRPARSRGQPSSSGGAILCDGDRGAGRSPPWGACGRGWHRAAGWATSAHTRGWTFIEDSAEGTEDVSPARAGIHRRCRTAPAPVLPVPRARGDRPRSQIGQITSKSRVYWLFGVQIDADLSRNDPRGAGSAGSTAGSTCTPAMTRRFVCLVLRRGQGRSIEARRQASRVSYPAPRPEQRPPRAHALSSAPSPTTASASRP